MPNCQTTNTACTLVGYLNNYRFILPGFDEIDTNETDLGERLREKYDAESKGPCFYDLWSDIDKTYENVSSYNNETYVEDIFYQEIESFLVDHVSSSDDPFFIYYSSYIVHSPIQAPPRVDNLNNNKKIDYSNCDLISNNGRKILCEMMQYFDYRLGMLESLLKTLDLWKNTLIVVSSDNGGGFFGFDPDDKDFFFLLSGFGTSLPLRGSKGTTFDGGVRSAAFITGGYLPQNLKGLKLDNLIGIEDWFATFINLANINPNTYITDNNCNKSVTIGDILNDLDSFNVWPDIRAFSNKILIDHKSGHSSDSSDSSDLVNSNDMNIIIDPFREQRSEWVDIGVVGSSCLVRNDGWKIVLNGNVILDRIASIAGTEAADYVEFEGSNNMEFESIGYSPYKLEMVFNVFDDSFERFNLVNQTDDSIQLIVTQLRDLLNEYIDGAFFKQGTLSGSLASLQVSIDTGLFIPWKDSGIYANFTDNLDQIEAVYQALLDF